MKRSVSIDRIALRFKGIPPGVIRTILAGLGREILVSLGDRKILVNLTRPKFIRDLDGGTIKVRDSIGSNELRKTIADGLVGRIHSAANESHEGM